MRSSNLVFSRLLFSLLLALIMSLALPLAAQAQDADGDGMPDSHEALHGCLMANTADGGG